MNDISMFLMGKLHHDFPLLLEILGSILYKDISEFLSLPGRGGLISFFLFYRSGYLECAL